MDTHNDNYQKEEFDYKKLLEETRNDSTSHQEPIKPSRHKNTWALLFVAVGALLLFRNLNFGFLDYLFRWEIILIAVSLAIGYSTRWKNNSWVIPFFVGAIFLTSDVIWNNYRMAIPLVFIGIGIYWYLGGVGYKCNTDQEDLTPTKAPLAEPLNAFATNAEYVTMTAIFAGLKRTVVSKNFRGGEIVSIFGGSEINFSNADFHGIVKLEAVNIFGGTKLFIPSDWDVRSEAVAILGGVEDKRAIRPEYVNPNKCLIIDGVVIMGGIEIRNAKS